LLRTNGGNERAPNEIVTSDEVLVSSLLQGGVGQNSNSNVSSVTSKSTEEVVVAPRKSARFSTPFDSSAEATAVQSSASRDATFEANDAMKSALDAVKGKLTNPINEGTTAVNTLTSQIRNMTSDSEIMSS
jgi:hypothetical protein